MAKEPDINLLKAGDKEAFRQLIESYQHKVVNTAFGFTHNRQDAEDVAQEVFLYVYRSLTGFKEKSLLSTWIYRITVNKALDYIKARQRKKRNAGTLDLSYDDAFDVSRKEENPEQQMLDKEGLRLLYEAINTLPDKQKKALILSKQEGLSNDEVAAVLKTTRSAVEALIHRAKQQLSKELERIERR